MIACTACRFANNEDAQFCGNCGAALAPNADGGAAAVESAEMTPIADDPHHVERWREALESFYLDGQVDAEEAAELGRLRLDLRVAPATLNRIESDVRQQFRPRVAVKMQSAAFAPVRAGSHVSVVLQIENVDSETYVDAACELIVAPIGYRQRESLGRFGYRARQRRTFQFRLTEPGAIPAELRIELQPREGLPIVVRSRGGDLLFSVQPAESAASVVYNVQAERIVGDFGVDKGINIGATPSATPLTASAERDSARAGADDWRTIILEIAPDLTEALAAERDKKARRQLISRPAQYRCGQLRIVSGRSVRDVTIVAGAVATLGRNSTTAGPNYSPNEIALRVEPTAEPHNAAATQQITGHAHLTLRYDGGRAVLIDGSTHGTVVNRTRKLARGEAAVLEDRLDVRVAGVLDLLFESFRSAGRGGDAAPPTFAADAPREALDRTLVGFDKPGELDAVRIRRPGNLTGELEHVLLVRQARIGSSPYDCIQIRGSGVCERHARLLVDQGQFWLERLTEEGIVRLNGDALEVGQRVGMRGGDVIEIGEARAIFSTAL